MHIGSWQAPGSSFQRSLYLEYGRWHPRCPLDLYARAQLCAVQVIYAPRWAFVLGRCRLGSTVYLLSSDSDFWSQLWLGSLSGEQAHSPCGMRAFIAYAKPSSREVCQCRAPESGLQTPPRETLHWRVRLFGRISRPVIDRKYLFPFWISILNGLLCHRCPGLRILNATGFRDSCVFACACLHSVSEGTYFLLPRSGTSALPVVPRLAPIALLRIYSLLRLALHENAEYTGGPISMSWCRFLDTNNQVVSWSGPVRH